MCIPQRQPKPVVHVMDVAHASNLLEAHLGVGLVMAGATTSTHDVGDAGAAAAADHYVDVVGQGEKVVTSC